MKLKIYKTLFIVLVIAFIVVSLLIAIKYWKSYQNENTNKEVVSKFLESIKQTQNSNNVQEQNQDLNGSIQNVTLNGYKVIGVIKIPKIGIEYPIVEVETYNPADTNEPMKTAIVKYWGGKVNEYGNLSVAGHNYYNGTMFGKTRKLEIGDIVELTDLNNKTIQYEIYKKFTTDPNDVTILASNNDEIREVTLITCTNGNRNRLILKAKEIN